MAYDISVIIPVYNSERYLSNCFNQLNAQSLAHVSLEIIFIDDGSRDGSLSMLKRYAKGKTNVKVIHQVNKKQAEARNTGLRAASGTFVAFVDSDDTFSKEYFNELFKQSFEADLVISGIKRVFADHTDELGVACFEGLKNSDQIVQKYASGNTELDAGVWSKLYRREFLIRNSIQFKNENFFEDSFFNLQVITHVNPHDIRYIHRCYYTLVKQVGSTTTQYNSEIDRLAQRYICLCEDYLQKNGVSERTVTIAIKSLITRTVIHVIHHHIKYDQNIDRYPIKKIIKHNVKMSDVFWNNLPKSYRVALLMLRFLPSLYCYIYRLEKVGKK